MKTRHFALLSLLLLQSPPLHAATVDWTGATDNEWGKPSNWSPSTAVPAVGDTARFNTAGVVAADIKGGNFTFGNGATSLNFLQSSNVTIADSLGGGRLAVDANGQNAPNNTINGGGGATYRIEVPLVARNTGGNQTLAGNFRLRTAGNSTLEFAAPITAETALEARTVNPQDVLRISGGIHFSGNNRGLSVLSNPAGASIRLGGNFTSGASDTGNYLDLLAGDVRLGSTTVVDPTIETVRLGGNATVTFEGTATDRIRTALGVTGNATLDLGAGSNTGTGTLAFSATARLNVDFSNAAASELHFADSSAVSWDAGAVLDLTGFNFATDKLRFGTSASGLTSQQLSQIRFRGTTGSFLLDANGYLKRAPAAKPNVVIIYTDDHGFTDLGIHGVDANVRTPNLDSLAANGALMLNGYSSSPQCVPSRAGIMTGRIQNTFGTRQNGDIWGRIPVPLDVPTIAERLVALGTYRTGIVGKWHLEIPAEVPDGEFPGTRSSYLPPARGFQEYFYRPVSPYSANFDLAGNTLAPAQSITDGRNRVIVQGEAAQAFIGRNQNQPFFLYTALYGPHWPRIDSSDPYYQNFPAVDYPNYNAQMDDIRRYGLGLVWAVDDAVGGVMGKLREMGLEENTLILFAGDNGAPPKFWDGVPGSATIADWTGCENLPLRGEKGSLWEGGMKVPMLAYWKGKIAPGTVIPEAVWTLDFTATTLKLAGGTIPAEFDGTDILPRLTGQETQITRTKHLFWDWGDEIAIRKGDWKFHRIGDTKSLFHISEDPYELYDLEYTEPAKFAELEADLMAWYNALPDDGQSPLRVSDPDLYITGAPGTTPVDPRFLIPYSSPVAAAYPTALITLADPSADDDGDGMNNGDETAFGRDPYDASDLAFEFNTDGNYQGWTPITDAYLTSHSVAGGFLTGNVSSNQGKFELYNLNFSAAAVNNILVRISSPQATGLTFRWGNTINNTFSANRTLTAAYPANTWRTVVVPVQGHPEWDGKTITRFRLNPANTAAAFQIDWVRGSTGDLDADGIPDTVEFASGYDAGDGADATVDVDGDGSNRLAEYIWGTSDSNPSSRFQSVFDMNGSGNPALSWDGLAGRNYRVWRSYSLVADSWQQIHETGTLGGNQTIQIEDAAAATENRAFYRIEGLYQGQ